MAERTTARGENDAINQSEGRFYLQQMRASIADLFEHRPLIYWTDFLLTTSLGYACAILYLRAPWFSLRQFICYVIAGFAFFRTASFIHEIVHLRRGLMPGFCLTWNVLFGVPMLMPSLLYSNHIDHHRHRHYGTEHDGEYQPLARRPIWALVCYWGQVLALPLLAYVRFLALVPLSLTDRRLRRWLLERFSSYGSNLAYRRVLERAEPYRLWLAADLAGFLSALGLAVSLFRGRIDASHVLAIYLLAVFTIGLNWLRNLAGHHFRNEGGPLTAEGQLTDSITVTGHPFWTELLFPLGLRYHALHHLYPSIPYHSLGAAHRRLMSTLPADALYRQTVYPNLRSVLKKLLRDANTTQNCSSCNRLNLVLSAVGW